ncbi:elongation factor Ts [Chryseobacterium carnipullorum]|uniref:Elongation factor Ts n=1 Tax=Chryseobacterium carnipullorum TaxID=1124835 RepID=A0A1M7B063_CHRCU|nr:translation elongation factor Ts [Chryseobacterium carnipullorum]MDN5395481.1 translation elongation factor Ts [Chryseobacterium sp.]AZA48272.1 elongation factor Ts [Chryseobacterium carnipullorum]AZA67574.1 elongation factor Ts [Chryseobacterium carnipullorum]MDN5475735.1 translation elongation factor Ts [Chryseobacterium sp.]SHL48276.1 translation elongation factor Ts (EF-Ts) [Chryseobacterium carnipullorum]
MSYTPVAADVAKLRNQTGAGMMDCKKALVEAEGDFEKAVDILRKKGQKVAANRADRESSEGAVIARVNEDNTLGVVISLNCETDFVAKNEAFIELAYELAEMAIFAATKEELLATDFHGLTVAEKLIEQTGVIGEKIEIGAFERIEGPFLGAYIHAGNKIAAITALSAKVDGADEAAKSVSMQVAAMNPIALDETRVSQETIDKELEIERELLIKEGKPENIIENILKGKMQKFYKDNTLVHQSFIKDGSISVADYVKSVNADLKVTGFVRISLA